MHFKNLEVGIVIFSVVWINSISPSKIPKRGFLTLVLVIYVSLGGSFLKNIFSTYPQISVCFLFTIWLFHFFSSVKRELVLGINKIGIVPILTRSDKFADASPAERWPQPLLLKFWWDLWLLLPIEYIGHDTMWVPRLVHKRPCNIPCGLRKH